MLLCPLGGLTVHDQDVVVIADVPQRVLAVVEVGVSGAALVVLLDHVVDDGDDLLTSTLLDSAAVGVDLQFDSRHDLPLSLKGMNVFV